VMINNHTKMFSSYCTQSAIVSSSFGDLITLGVFRDSIFSICYENQASNLGRIYFEPSKIYQNQNPEYIERCVTRLFWYEKGSSYQELQLFFGPVSPLCRVCALCTTLCLADLWSYFC
jgi:hypothetical protein